MKKQKIQKSKTTAIWLAILFGIFSWLYTYKYNAWKFWTCLGLTIATLGLFGIVSFIWAVIDNCVADRKLFEQYYE